MIDLSQEEWNLLIKEAANSFLLDVRTEEEFQEGHLADATFIDIRQPQEFMDAVQKLDKSKSYFIYCRSGARSAQACQLLDQLGVTATYNLKGGILEWQGDVVSE